ncbi:Smr protein/MutS2 [Dinoroseobacter shibae DFL 12 = DSM 16493]|jgi:DNA-nicking Smr family endonuclease|uniref:Smr protein/MutS2 n=1 Tax=Dinoroseobacter shibae (strain DSM 16493 / NCIMB 14021 / DFL 12) TaxID=398580 RepID=A8LPB1_DINSH|nr:MULTISPECIES: Smr/MutS family protein [Dinoroseobacter]ABV95176.1 Smr protein/MutS2 [Dinoroseobacter shibae DFL 12 = DSM 16493]MDD9718105.1 Smr/MutS family protein [Dinoroseobacter sp. PD6]URF46589.1 Smr/MutS family protein [Dinoroseobacter shibae]URF50895.1 Smr/MutS family protein [Dinoroseobacter shibae]
MSKRPPRRLRPDEEEIWKRVAETATPLSKPRFPMPQDVTPSPRKARSPEKEPISPFSIGSGAGLSETHDLAPGLGERIAAAPVTMDRKAFGKLKRGKLKPEGRLDLHGMTLSQAHPALNRFILGAHSQGKRLVLVITGKGKDRDQGGPIPERLGVLRHQVPHWLSIPPLSSVVLQVTTAHLRHGGGGAYYVYLKRPR